MSEQVTIDILECFSCGSKHTKIPLNVYNCPYEPWTHHYTCPTSKDPVSIATSQVGGKPAMIHQDIAKFLEQAKRAGHYLVAVFHKKEMGTISESNPLNLSMRTENYDLGWSDTTWIMLRDQLRREQDKRMPVEEPDYPKPQPIAEPLEGLTLFEASTDPDNDKVEPNERTEIPETFAEPITDAPVKFGSVEQRYKDLPSTEEQP